MLGWLTGLPDSALPAPRPTPDEVHTALDLVNLLRPLRAVADDAFVGRQHELAILEQFVSGSSAPRLVVHGIGGMGKSTLLSHFLLTTVVYNPRRSFAYLSFDQADLRPDRPLSLLAEAARQLALQHPELAPELGRLETTCRANLEQEVRRQLDVASTNSPHTSPVYSLRATKDERGLASRLGKITAGIDQVWVLDTFEQAQRRGEVALLRLWDFVEQLGRSIKGLRVIIAGRLPVAEHADGPAIALAGLDPTTARQLLRRRLGDLPVDDEVLDEVVGLVRANPLSLRLAAESLRRDGVQVWNSPESRTAMLAGLRAEQVQGLLYRRNLDHIANADVRALANPGLALRRITPEIIAKVLAGPCGLGPLDPWSAHELFDRLADEVFLVERTEQNVLVHRTDIRREMLPLLRADDPVAFEAINRAAVRYYHALLDPAARVEELYHRLMAGETSRTLDQHWDPTVEQLLLPALDELPATSRAYLAQKLGLAADSGELHAAADDTWALHVARQARDLLEAGRAKDALQLLGSRTLDHTPVQLTALEAEALAMIGDYRAAMETLTRGTAAAAATGRTADMVALTLLGARMAQDVGDLVRAGYLYGEAGAMAETHGDPIATLAAAVGRLRTYRLSGDTTSPDYLELRDGVLGAVQRLDPRQRAANPALVRELAAELGGLDTQLVIDAVRLNGLDVLGDGADRLDAEGLGDHVRTIQEQAIDQWTQSAPVTPAPLSYTSAEQAQAVVEYLSSAPLDDAVQSAVSEVYQQEVDRDAFTYDDSSSDDPSS